MKELPEYKSSLKGLRHWQKVALTSSDVHNMTQGTMDEVLLQIDKEPQLRIAMFGDSEMILTPSKRPPSNKVVNKWLNNKIKFCKAVKDEKVKTTEETKSEAVKIAKPVPKIGGKKEYKKGPNFKKSKKTNTSNNQQDSCSFQPISPPLKSILKSPKYPNEEVGSLIEKPNVISPESVGSSYNLPGLKSPELLESSIMSSRNRSAKLVSPEFVSSTPARRVSFEGDDPVVTPIPKINVESETPARRVSFEGETPSRSAKRLKLHKPKKINLSSSTQEVQRDDDGVDDNDIIPPSPEQTPASQVPSTSSTTRSIATVKPIRRLSTGTESTLRRALLTSQIKVCLILFLRWLSSTETRG